MKAKLFPIILALMKTKLLPFLCVLCVLCVRSAAFARLGETEAQIEKRYGKTIPPVMPNAGVPMKMYRAAGMLIGVSYIDGRSEAELYQKKDETALTDHEIQLLLESNAGGKKWAKAEPVTVAKDNWLRDGAAAAYDKFSTKPTLMIMSLRFMAISKANREAEEQEKLKGF